MGFHGQRITVYPKENVIVVYTANFTEDNPGSENSLADINNNFILPSISLDTTTLSSQTANPDISESFYSPTTTTTTTNGYGFLIIGLGMVFTYRGRKNKKN